MDQVPSEQVNTHGICSPTAQLSKFIFIEHFRFDKFTEFKEHFSNQAEVWGTESEYCHKAADDPKTSLVFW